MDPIVVTRMFKVSETIGIIEAFAPKIANNAVYDEPPPRPTDA